MALLAPYHDAMKLGSGFNSFTQELCLDGAVIREDGVSEKLVPTRGGEKVPQLVTYKTSIVEKLSDIFDTLNINAAFTVKFGKGNVEGGADFLNVAKIKNSDLTFMVSCKVVNQIVMDQTLTKFSAVQVKPTDFPRVYGDSFISGFQEGGEFIAVISVRAKDRSQAHTIKADASVSLTLDKASGDVGLGIDKVKQEILNENETTVSVSWTGGGQEIKKPEEDWTFDTMRAVALRFSDLVAQCPVKTHAVLTKYTSLKSFYSSKPQFIPLSYENARVYTAGLRDAYLDYQHIAKSLSVLALDVNAGTHRLVSQTDKLEKDFGQKTLKASDPSLLENILDATQTNSLQKDLEAKSAADEDANKDKAIPAEKPEKKASDAPISDSASDEGVVVNNEEQALSTNKDAPKEDVHLPKLGKVRPPDPINPLVITKPYPPTIHGLESARMQCRFMMNRIVAEVDKVANYPEIATDETRALPYMSPFLFNLLLPVGIPIPQESASMLG